MAKRKRKTLPSRLSLSHNVHTYLQFPLCWSKPMSLLNSSTFEQWFGINQVVGSFGWFQRVTMDSVGSVRVVFFIPTVTKWTQRTPILSLFVGQLLLLPNTLLNPKIPIIYLLHSAKLAAPFLYSSLFPSLSCFFFFFFFFYYYYSYIHFYLLLLKIEALLKAKIN